MKSILKAFSAVALSGAMVLPALAQTATATGTTTAKDQKDLKKVIEDQGINYVETAQKGITLSGYVDTSYTEQFAGAGQYAPAKPFATNPGGGPGNTQGTIVNGTNAGSNIHQFDTSNNTFNVNAVKIALEKALPDKNEWAAGFRIDTIYGSDAKYLGDTAFNGTAGNTSGLALEQALVKFRIPIGNGLDIYMGKFVTFLGYEVIESPANLNFSRGLLFTNAIPLTHTGIYGDYKFNDTVEVKLGIVDGWNNSTSSSVAVPAGSTGINDDGGFGKAITGQINVNAPGKNANITQSFIYSDQGEPGVVGVDNGPLVVYDIWGNWNPTFVKDSALTLGLNADLGYNGASGYPGSPSPSAFGTVGAPTALNGSISDSNTWWGVAAYASYKFTKVFTLSARGEYLHEDAAWNPKFGATDVINDDFSETLTASFSIWDNLLTRLEYRYDHYTSGTIVGVSGAVDKGAFSNENEISLNAVYSF